MGRQVWKSCPNYVGLISATNVVEPHILPCLGAPWLCPLFQIKTCINFHIHFFRCASHLMYVESIVSASSTPIWLWLKAKIDILIFWPWAHLPSSNAPTRVHAFSKPICGFSSTNAPCSCWKNSNAFCPWPHFTCPISWQSKRPYHVKTSCQTPSKQF